MKLGIIYKITSPSGKVYIGQTISPIKRFEKYRNLKCKYQPKLYNSFIKYGYENHKLEILCEVEKELLNELEVYYIELYNSYKDGMNCTIGGDINPMSGRTHTDEVKKILSDKSILAWKNGLLGKNKYSKKIINTKTGEIYPSLKIAAEKSGINYSTLRAYLTDKRRINKTEYIYL